MFIFIHCRLVFPSLLPFPSFLLLFFHSFIFFTSFFSAPLYLFSSPHGLSLYYAFHSLLPSSPLSLLCLFPLLLRLVRYRPPDNMGTGIIVSLKLLCIQVFRKPLTGNLATSSLKICSQLVTVTSWCRDRGKPRGALTTQASGLSDTRVLQGGSDED